MLQIFIALKNPSPWLGLNSQTLVQMASMLTFTPLRQLGSKVNCINDISAEIRKKNILFANRCFHRLGKHFKSELISKETKKTLYKVVVRPGNLQRQMGQH
jgi:hypothetical protein